MPNYVLVRCPSCGTQIPADDINLANMAAKCRTCHALVDLRAAGGIQGAAAPTSELTEALPVPLPSGLHASVNARELRLVRRWFSPKYVFMAFFALMWNGFLVLWYAMAINGPLVALLFPLLHVTVGLGLAYATVAGFLNQTTVVVERGHLSVRHGPVPWMGNRDLATGTLAQLYCQEHISQGRNSTTVTYSVQAATRDGRKVGLVSGLTDPDQARFIEQQVEKFLGIANRPVQSEMRR